MIPEHTAVPNAHRRPGRRGLSTLEMVLCLPILLFVMALMINFGAYASWKVRGLSTARHRVWSARRRLELRPPPNPPRPASWWPSEASWGVQSAGDIAALDDPRVNLPVVRGPLPPGGVVNDRLLAPPRGLRRGRADLDRRFPLLSSLDEYHLDARHHLLIDAWQFQQMRWAEQGNRVPENNWRRMPVLYALQETNWDLVIEYYRAAMAILNAPFREDLRPLDDDPEFLYYKYRFGWRDKAEDFHPPRLRPRERRADPPHDFMTERFCSLDHGEAQRWVQGLIDQIQGRRADEDQDIWRVISVAEDMADWFTDNRANRLGVPRGVYPRAIWELQNLINADPPPPPSEIASIQAEIADLEARIRFLTAFVQRL